MDADLTGFQIVEDLKAGLYASLIPHF